MTSTADLSRQMKHQNKDLVPLFLVRAMFGLMLAALALVTYATLTDRPHTGVPATSPVVRSLPIVLEGDRSSGIHVVSPDGQKLAYSADDKNGFIDVVWLSVMRERTVQHVSKTAPLSLQRLENGHTLVTDTSTGWSIDLISFGSDNVAAFARLID